MNLFNIKIKFPRLKQKVLTLDHSFRTSTARSSSIWMELSIINAIWSCICLSLTELEYFPDEHENDASYLSETPNEILENQYLFQKLHYHSLYLQI